MSSESAVSHLRSRTEPFNYLPYGEANSTDRNGGTSDRNAANVVPQGLLEQQDKQGFERGLKEGEARANKAYEQNLAATRASVSRALEEFKAQRESYFGRVEPEVVQLALSIARKILHREAQMDPLLLTGMVHVALEKLDQGTRVHLRAHPEEVQFWNRYFSEAKSLAMSPEIVGDATLERGECALETEIGSTQISLDTQLKEIEQGFFDLLEQRPQVR
jgi:flagellar assembly protein FliH